MLANTLSEVSIDAGVITAGTFRGPVFETSANVNVSKVMFDTAGMRGYDATGSTFNLDSTGKLTLGGIAGQDRIEIDRTSFRSYSPSALQFSIIDGVLTTGGLTGARVELTSLGLKAYNASSVNTVAINTDGSASFTGTINLTGSTLQGSIGGDNLIYNSGFEILTGTGYDGWIIQGGGTGSIVTNASVGVDGGRTVGPGSRALKITTTANSQYGYVEAAVAKRHPVVAGETYSLTAYVGASTTGRTAYMSVNWYNSAGGNIGSSVSVTTAVTISATGMTRIGGPIVAPGAGLPVGDVARAAFASIRPVGGANTVTGDAYYFDNLMFQQGNVPTEYFPRGDELLAGTTWESNLNTNVSKVMMDVNGIRGYDATGATFNLDTAGKLTLGKASPLARLEVDRTAFKYFNDSNLQTFSIINGVLTTGAADSGARVRMDNLGIKAYNAAGLNTVSINSDGTAQFVNMGGNNLVSNGNFMDPTASGTWERSGFITALLETAPDNFIFGTQGVKLTASVAGGNCWIGKRDVIANRIAVQGNRPYTQSIYIKTGATNVAHNFQLYFYWYDSANALITTSTQTLYTPATIGSWFRATPYTITSPPNARYAGFLAHFRDTLPSEVYYVDGYQIEEGDMVTPFKPIEQSVLSEVSVNAGVLTAGTLRGTTVETSSAALSVVRFDAPASVAMTRRARCSTLPPQGCCRSVLRLDRLA